MGQQSEPNPEDPPLLVPTSRAPTPPPPTGDPPWLDWHGLLKNRFILGGLGVLVVLLLVAIVLFTIGGDDDDGASVSIQPTPDGAEGTAVIGPGLRGEMLATVGSRAGPGNSYVFLGLIRSGTVLTVVGRNEDNTWYQVIYPPGSTLRVWVVASAIEIRGDTSVLVVAGPAEGPDVALPTFEGSFEPIPTEPGGTEIEETPTAVELEPTRTPRATSTPPPTWTPRAPTATPGGQPTPAGQPPKESQPSP